MNYELLVYQSDDVVDDGHRIGKVLFGNAENVASAVEKLNETELKGSVISVSPYQPQVHTQMFTQARGSTLNRFVIVPGGPFPVPWLLSRTGGFISRTGRGVDFPYRP